MSRTLCHGHFPYFIMQQEHCFCLLFERSVFQNFLLKCDRLKYSNIRIENEPTFGCNTVRMKDVEAHDVTFNSVANYLKRMYQSSTVYINNRYSHSICTLTMSDCQVAGFCIKQNSWMLLRTNKIMVFCSKSRHLLSLCFTELNSFETDGIALANKWILTSMTLFVWDVFALKF